MRISIVLCFSLGLLCASSASAQVGFGVYPYSGGVTIGGFGSGPLGGWATRTMSIDPRTGAVQYRTDRITRNPFTGGQEVSSHFSNPLRGVSRFVQNRIDPFSGAFVSRSGEVDSLTGRTQFGATVADPRTGKIRSSQRAYDVRKGEIRKRIVSYDPSSGKPRSQEQTRRLRGRKRDQDADQASRPKMYEWDGKPFEVAPPESITTLQQPEVTP